MTTKPGRPPEVQRQLTELKDATKKAQLVQRELKSLAELTVGFKIGRQILLDSFPTLIERAVQLATDAEKPDRTLLLGLIAQATKLVGEDSGDEDSGIKRLLGSLKGARDINVSQTNIYGRETRTIEVMEEDGSGSSGRTEN